MVLTSYAFLCLFYRLTACVTLLPKISFEEATNETQQYKKGFWHSNGLDKSIRKRSMYKISSKLKTSVSQQRIKKLFCILQRGQQTTFLLQVKGYYRGKLVPVVFNLLALAKHVPSMSRRESLSKSSAMDMTTGTGLQLAQLEQHMVQ